MSEVAEPKQLTRRLSALERELAGLMLDMVRDGDRSRMNPGWLAQAEAALERAYGPAWSTLRPLRGDVFRAAVAQAVR